MRDKVRSPVHDVVKAAGLPHARSYPSLSFMRIVRLLCLIFALASAGPEAFADQKDPRLNDLFARLKAAPNGIEAAGIERQIWTIWTEHPDEDVADLMRKGTKAMMVDQDFIEALKTFDSVIEKAPEFAEGWNKRATVHYLMGNYDLSLHDIDETLALEPRHFGALSGRGLVFIKLEELRDALEAFEEALKVHPRMSGPRANAKALRDALGEGEDI